MLLVFNDSHQIFLDLLLSIKWHVWSIFVRVQIEIKFSNASNNIWPLAVHESRIVYFSLISIIKHNLYVKQNSSEKVKITVWTIDHLNKVFQSFDRQFSQFNSLRRKSEQFLQQIPILRVWLINCWDWGEFCFPFADGFEEIVLNNED